MKKVIILVVILIVVIGSVAGYLYSASMSYVAKVGRERIENHEYIFFLNAQKITTETEAGIKDEQGKKELWENPVDGEDPVTVVVNQALENAKELKIQLIKAKEAKFELSDQEKKELQAYLDSMLQNVDNVNYVKNDLGLTLAQFRDIVWKSELAGSFAYDYMEKNSGEISITDDEIKNFYEENKNTIDEVIVRYLFISAQPTEKAGEKKELAENLLDRIKSGEDMPSLIKEFSEDTDSKENEGVFSFTREDELYEQEVRDWAFSVKTGELGIVETQSGYYIIRLEYKKGFEEHRENIISSLKYQKMNEFYYKQLEEWKNDPEYNLVKNEKILKKITEKIFQL